MTKLEDKEYGKAFCHNRLIPFIIFTEELRTSFLAFKSLSLHKENKHTYDLDLVLST